MELGTIMTRRLRVLMFGALVIGPAYALALAPAYAGGTGATRTGNNSVIHDPYPADYLLPYGTYNGGYSNWRTYGLVGNRISQYGPFNETKVAAKHATKTPVRDDVPRWQYNVKTGNPDGFDLEPR